MTIIMAPQARVKDRAVQRLGRPALHDDPAATSALRSSSTLWSATGGQTRDVAGLNVRPGGKKCGWSDRVCWAMPGMGPRGQTEPATG